MCEKDCYEIVIIVKDEQVGRSNGNAYLPAALDCSNDLLILILWQLSLQHFTEKSDSCVIRYIKWFITMH